MNIPVIGYDIFDLLVNFWDKQINNPEEFYKELKKLKNTKEEYEKIKNILKNTGIKKMVMMENLKDENKKSLPSTDILIEMFKNKEWIDRKKLK